MKYREEDGSLVVFFDTERERQAFIRDHCHPGDGLRERVERLEYIFNIRPFDDPVLPLVVRPGNPWRVEDQRGVVMGTLDLVWLINRPIEQGRRVDDTGFTWPLERGFG